MKYKTTTKHLKATGNNLRYCGYCDLQYLLYYTAASAYTSGGYGWNYDVYECYGLTICTGYRGMPGTRLEYVKEYEDRAEKIIHDYKSNTQKEDITNLLKEFCAKNGGWEYEAN